jgi:hypothetical protein
MLDGDRLIEGDGVVTNMYYFLWRMKEQQAAARENTSFDDHFAIRVPSTVIVEHNYPKAWYYTQKGSSVELDRKLGKDIDSLSILKDFCGTDMPPASREEGGKAQSPRNKPHQIVAAYFCRPKFGGVIVPKEHHSPLDTNAAPSVSTIVEYMNEAQLRDFLLRRTVREDGFVQKWVHSLGKSNSVIQAVWTPHLCLITRRNNVHAARDIRVSMYERSVTFEGPAHLSTESFVAPHIHYLVERSCEQFVNHMLREHSVAIRRMVLYFKMDTENRIWFLWASSVRAAAHKTILNLSVRYIPRTPTTDPSTSTQGVGARKTEDNTRANAMPTARPSTREFLQQLFDEAPVPDCHRAATAGTRTPPTRRHQTEEDKVLALFPRPPSMGPMPLSQLDQLKPRRTRRPQPTAVMRDDRPSDRPEKKKTKRRKSRSQGAQIHGPQIPRIPLEQWASLSASLQLAAPASSLISVGGATQPFSMTRSSQRWRAVSALAKSGAIAQDGRVRAACEFLLDLPYAAYSHFLCSGEPYAVEPPVAFAAVFPFERPEAILSSIGYVCNDGGDDSLRGGTNPGNTTTRPSGRSADTLDIYAFSSPLANVERNTKIYVTRHAAPRLVQPMRFLRAAMRVGAHAEGEGRATTGLAENVSSTGKSNSIEIPHHAHPIKETPKEIQRDEPMDPPEAALL